jgi:hypothetical protein
MILLFIIPDETAKRKFQIGKIGRYKYLLSEGIDFVKDSLDLELNLLRCNYHLQAVFAFLFSFSFPFPMDIFILILLLHIIICLARRDA